MSQTTIDAAQLLVIFGMIGFAVLISEYMERRRNRNIEYSLPPLPQVCRWRTGWTSETLACGCVLLALRDKTTCVPCDGCARACREEEFDLPEFEAALRN